MADKVGQQIGNYRLVRLLGTGGFAEVYLGQHVIVQNLQAAIKVLHTNLPQSQQAGFFQEAETIALLKHPHIIRILEFGIDSRDNSSYLIMDYAPNGTLRNRHPKGSIVPLSTVAEYVKQIAPALQYAHNHKIIHCDLKPENLLIGENNEIVVSDFGIARFIEDTSLIETVNAYAGTLPYSSPEHIKRKPRPASDQYSLGIIVYEWLCGERPFNGDIVQLIYQHEFGITPPLHEKIPTISPKVETVVMIALAKDPKQRFASIQAFATAFEQACMSSYHSDLPTQPVPPSQPPHIAVETRSTQQNTVKPLDYPITTTRVRTGGVVSRKGLILIGLILLLVVLFSVLGGASLYTTHLSQVNASATATVIPRLTATATARNATVTATAKATATSVSTTATANAPYGGTLALSDPLQRNSGLVWLVASDNMASCQFSAGAYHVSTAVAGMDEICEPGSSKNFSDLAFEVSMKIIKGGFGGLAFRYNHTLNSGYLLFVGQSGTCDLYINQKGSTTLLTEIVTPAVHQGYGQTNIIAVAAKGSTIMLYVNGQQIGSVDDTSFSSGIFGLLAGSFQGGQPTEVAYNNAKIWTF